MLIVFVILAVRRFRSNLTTLVRIDGNRKQTGSKIDDV